MTTKAENPKPTRRKAPPKKPAQPTVIDGALVEDVPPDAPNPGALWGVGTDAMRDSVALAQTYVGSPDFHDSDIVTMYPAGPGKVIGCEKCEDCGWSVTRSEGELNHEAS